MMTSEWADRLDAVDARLVDEFQSGFPVEAHPYRAIGAALGVDEADALDRVRRLHDRGVFRRVGPVLNPPVIGSSTLAALRAPEDRFEEIAAIVNDHRQVNHNYRRAHEWNMWFVVTAGSRETRDAILADIEERTGCPVLNLPMHTDYYINLEFPVVNGDRFARETAAGDRTPVEPTRVSETAGDLSELEARLLLAVQEGFPLTATPYADVAEQVGATRAETVAGIEDLLDRGCIKRVGCVVNHVRTGFDANCMVVWDVPDEDLDDRGVAVGSLPFVTLCYRRPRRPEQGWPYTLFTMIHGREQSAVDEKIDELATDHLPYDHERLYSTETLKQTGARYEELLNAERSADASSAQ